MKLGLIIASLLAAPPSFAANDAPYAGYAVRDSQVRLLHSDLVGIDYKLYVGLPRGYAAGASSYPVVMLLDADSSFAMVRGVVDFLADHDELPPFILVGIAYPGVAEETHGPVYKRNRTRDYTPTHVSEGGYGKEFQKVSGGGDRFIDFLAQELIPYLEREFRIVPDRTLVGHSYGGLLASYALLTRPGLFQRLVILSPSLWWDRGLISRIERREAGRFKDGLPARVFFAAGKDEKPGMAKDLTNFAAELTSRRYPGFRSKLWLAPDEAHHTVFPAAVTRGLSWVFSPRP